MTDYVLKLGGGYRGSLPMLLHMSQMGLSNTNLLVSFW